MGSERMIQNWIWSREWAVGVATHHATTPESAPRQTMSGHAVGLVACGEFHTAWWQRLVARTGLMVSHGFPIVPVLLMCDFLNRNSQES